MTRIAAVFTLLATLPAPGVAAAQTAIAIGVAPVESSGFGASAIAARVQGVLEAELQNAPRVQLVERSRLADVLAEGAYQHSGATGAAASALGQQHNVDKLLFAEVSGRHPRFQLSLKVVDVASGKVAWTAADSLGSGDAETARRTAALVRRLARLAVALNPTEMILHAGGQFVMGSTLGTRDEGPEHAVRVDDFYLDRTEVSRAAYEMVRRESGLGVTDSGAPDSPATLVSWTDADRHCRAVGKRLPTEAEWELAARGSDGRVYPWGEEQPSAALVRFSGEARGPSPIDRYGDGASQNGVLNLAGNVAEWVSDWWDPTYYERSPANNPRGPLLGDYRIVRGGSWADGAFELRTSARAYHNPDKGAAYIGFRCARSAR